MMIDRVLKILYQNIGQFVSGQNIGRSLGVSRSAVSKSITELKNKGLNILSVSNKGHMLVKMDDVLDSDIITALTDKKTVFFDTCQSTNIEARKLTHIQDIELVIANTQAKGRGRRGRAFVSATGGVYMTYILMPDLPPRHSMLINLAAGLAVFDTLTKYGFEPFLKYPNDIYLDGKKVCGILTETLADADTLMWAITGIGLNVNNEIEEDLADIAVSLSGSSGKNFLRAEIIKEIINQFDYYMTQDIVRHYRQKCAMIGSEITLINDDGTKINAIAVDIRDDGLLLIGHNGTNKVAVGGEVSVRMNN